MVLKVRNAPTEQLKDDAATVDKDTTAAATEAKTAADTAAKIAAATEANTDNDSDDSDADNGGDDNSALIDGGSGEVIEEGGDAGDTGSATDDNAGETQTAAEPEATAAEDASDEVVDTQASAEEPKTASEPSKAVATKSTSTGVAVASPGGDKVAQFLQQLQEEGQAGLEMGYGVFPVLSLDKGEFKINDEEIGSDAFSGVALQSMPKFAYRTTGVAEKEIEVAFSDTDTAHNDPDSAVSAKILEWKEKYPSSGYEIKTYQNVIFYVSEMPAKPIYEGQIIILSVAPQSIRRYTGTCLTIKSKGYKVHEAVMQVSRGEKVRGDFDFYPWHFAPLGSCRKLGVEVKFGTVVDENF